MAQNYTCSLRQKLSFKPQQPYSIINRWINWNQLKSESFLKKYGYNASEKDGLSNRDRREILAEVIDLALLEPKEILKHLDWLIRIRKDPMYACARCKWADDMKFVDNYHKNPSRFLIAKQPKAQSTQKKATTAIITRRQENEKKT